MPIMLFVILALIFVILLIVVTNIVIVPQSMVYVVERLGSYSDTWSAGLQKGQPEGAGRGLSSPACDHPR